MSPDTPDGPLPSGWEGLMRSLFGDGADDAMRELREQGMDPAAMAAAAGIPDDPAAIEQIMAQVRAVLGSSGEGSVNWGVAHDVARQSAVAEGDPSLTDRETRVALEALSVAELWLDTATDLPPAGGHARAWSRSEWVEQTLPTWRVLTEPVATSMSDAISEAVSDQLGEGGLEQALGDPAANPGLAGLLGGQAGLGPGGADGADGPALDPSRIVRQLGSAVFGLQLGKAAGSLSRQVFGVSDIGFPLVEDPIAVLVPHNVEEFSAGQGVPPEEIRLYLALREAAHARLYAHAPWLRAHVNDAIAQYARGITFDLDALEEQVRSLDLSDPSAMQSALTADVFAPQTSAEQRASLDRLETVLALVEGWVDEVATTAARAQLPHAEQLREMIRRRRAAGGPGERTFADLVGLELRPRRSREAAALWAHLAAEQGTSARDAVWQHPDLMPDAADLDDPTGYASRRAKSASEQTELDDVLAAILDEAAGEEPGSAPEA